ncbi:MAG: acylphosphatase [Candidatus Omnitrophica bacterium]|nr:acylphosphatase [Candidatus Omnitrophota bacterium]
MKDRQIHAFFSGKVQGVGFRFTSQLLARQAGVTGWVQNLDDGRVELIAQAGAAALERFLSELDAVMGRHIRTRDIEAEPISQCFSDFTVRY